MPVLSIFHLRKGFLINWVTSDCLLSITPFTISFRSFLSRPQLFFNTLLHYFTFYISRYFSFTYSLRVYFTVPSPSLIYLEDIVTLLQPRKSVRARRTLSLVSRSLSTWQGSVERVRRSEDSYASVKDFSFVI
ncbi:hypothetical protein B0H67DRAFT_571087 [Lasiosphaeris hirsuta]|uniref:Uncharacterized protein n=1 Tax=Lasiosphaeris hirsuta TaxID=260670 RepID=A0AA40B128_9PEZI|nr:hypothetical protein B0H67DRAFT_571087 [Lasiosphaeris hirsuta]